MRTVLHLILVHDLFQMYSLVVHVLDSLYDSLLCIEIGSKCCQSFELLPFEAHPPATPDGEITLVWQVPSVVLVMVLQEMFGDIWDITQIFLWDPGGGEFSLQLRLLGDKQFQGGWTIMSPFKPVVVFGWFSLFLTLIGKHK